MEHLVADTEGPERCLPLLSAIGLHFVAKTRTEYSLLTLWACFNHLSHMVRGPWHKCIKGVYKPFY